MLIVKGYEAFCLQRQKAERGHNKQMLTTIFSFNSLSEIWPGKNVCSQSFVMLIVKGYEAFCLQRQKAERGHNKQMLTTIFSFNSLSCGSNTQVGQAYTKMFSIR